MSISSNQSTSSSESTSAPTFLETPENSIIDQISAVASGLASQMVNWAQGVYAHTSDITNQAVGNFFQVSQNMLGMSKGMTDQYNNLFAPENAQLVADANSYASPARMAVNMGQAGATQAQAGDQALHNSEEALRSYGINPADGRYASLDKAAAVQNAANVAGAMNTQRNADIATGQRLRSEAVQVGAQLPAAISNVNNTGIQANTGASNATLANANTGKNLMGLPNDFLKTAMDVKLPISGQNTQSHGSSQGTGSSSSPDKGGGSGSGRGGGGDGSGGYGGGGGPAWMPQHTGYQPSSGSGGGRYGQPNSLVANVQGRGGFDPPGKEYPEQLPPTGGAGFPQFEEGSGSIGGQTTDGVYGMGDTTGLGDVWDQNPLQDRGFGQSLPNEDIWGGGNGTFGDLPDMNTDTGGLGDYTYDPSANQAQLPPDWNDPPPQMSTDPGIWGGGGSDSESGGYDTGSIGSDYYAGDYSAPSDTYDMGGAYSRGGPIPPTASPSGGRQVDDVSAQGPTGQPMRMNANEFVIPDDVALWKGQEFFQNLIDQSRKKRMGAPAKPQPMR